MEHLWAVIGSVVGLKLNGIPDQQVCLLPAQHVRLSYVNHAEDLASKLLQCSPKNRLSAQAALSHEYFSDLPPRLWELTDSE
ncbi:Cyclin-dependent kinase 14 [Microtus ochrogaster]|uniref:Cyclin-dependent kinase 14 n=1 Tax=Microtus ochrogaster TaxID=79684 RepID=A0A8J6GF28_MICOH|nr:Cyclin-dependent kinase 14 [Microtus ochrogaster]